MRLLAEMGAKKFAEMIVDPFWKFIPEQWQAQMWSRLFSKIPPENLIYCTLEIPEHYFSWLPGADGRNLVPKAKSLQELMQNSLNWALKKLHSLLGKEPEIAFLSDGPYGIPLPSKNKQLTAGKS